MDKKGQMVTIFFSFFLILMIVTLISIESSNLKTNQNLNSLVQKFTIPQIQYYSYLNLLSNINSIDLSNQTMSILNSTLNNIYDSYFNNLNISGSSLNTSSFFIQLPIRPSQILSYFPTTFYNAQDVATSSPFQQMINVNYSVYGNYSNAELSNIEFFYFNGTVIPSWLESYSTSGAIWWLKIGSIPASSSLTIYMGFASKSSNLFNTTNDGEAPQLSSTYGKYDDGANVFNFYDNFSGTSLNTNKWSVNGLSYSVNNGITLDVPSSGIGTMNSIPTFTKGSTFDFYGTPSTNAGRGGFDFGVGDCVNCNSVGDSWMVGIDNGYSGYNLYLNNSNTATNYVQSLGVWTVGLYFDGITSFSMINYTNLYTVTNPSFNPSPNTYIILMHAGNSGNTFIQWFDERSAPPNGVMPSVSFSENLP